MIALITLVLPIGGDSGPFNLLSNVDGYTIPFEINIPTSSLVAGYTSIYVPEGTTIIRVLSTGICTNYIDIQVNLITTTTTTSSTSTSTTSTSSTTSTTTTATPTTTTTSSSSTSTSTSTSTSSTTSTSTTSVPTTTTTTTPALGVCTKFNTDGTDTINYIDCRGNPQTIVNTESDFCAQNGTVTGNGVSIITPNTCV